MLYTWLFTVTFLVPWNSERLSSLPSLVAEAGCKKCKSKPVIAIETKKVIPIPVPYPVHKKCKKKKKPKTIVVTIPEKKKCYGGCGAYYYDYYAPPIYYDYYQYIDVPGVIGGGVGGVAGGGGGFGGGAGTVPIGKK